MGAEWARHAMCESALSILHSVDRLNVRVCMRPGQAAIISLYCMNRQLFITETEYVYCAVKTDCLHIIRVNFRL